ncbi:MAG: hypothetical protein ABJN84_01855 [Flavobacteriaceae bacterium]
MRRSFCYLVMLLFSSATLFAGHSNSKVEGYDFDCNDVQVTVYELSSANGISEDTAMAIAEAAYHACMEPS